MSRSARAGRLAVQRQLPLVAGTAAALVLAVAAGVALAELLMSPPAAELWDLALYFAIAGFITIAAGSSAIAAADRWLAVSIQTKAFLAGLIAMAVALLNVFIIAQLMFISDEHDLQLLLAVLLFTAIVTACFSFLVARTTSSRLNEVAGAVRRLADQDLAARAEIPGGDEVARLAEDVNILAERLSEAERQQRALEEERKELTTAISHDLRTPLSSLRAMIEALDDEVVDGDQVRRYYGAMRREIDRLARMIEDLFELAQIDSGALRLHRESVSINEIAADVVDSLQAQARQANVDLRFIPGAERKVSVDGSRIERAVANLVRNALEHTPPGGVVEVSVGSDKRGLRLKVADSGEGIHPDDLPKIWDRFYRAEKSRRRNGTGDGAGLGLAIVRGIVEAHGGEVSVESGAGRGAAFTLTLPAG